MAGRYGRRHIKDEEFEEGEIWNIMEDKQNPSNYKKQPFNKFPTTNNSRHHSSTTPKMIPRSSSSSSNSTNEITPHQQFSAPVDIPDWSKIYGNKNNFTSSSWVHVDHHNNNNNGYYATDNDDGDGDDDDDGVVPPHEYIAKKLARSQISSFSVYEGIGRTLKGRDLSKLRNAILTKTGFLE